MSVASEHAFRKNQERLQHVVSGAPIILLVTDQEGVITLAEVGLAEMRALIFELRPESLEKEGLVAALKKQVDSVRARHGIRFQVDFCDEPPALLPVKEALYRITQEAIWNITKHARASVVELRLSMNEGSLQLHIRDDGRGFDGDGDFSGHLGLKSMRERASKLGGRLEIDNSPGSGTAIRVEMPLR